MKFIFFIIFLSFLNWIQNFHIGRSSGRLHLKKLINTLRIHDKPIPNIFVEEGFEEEEQPPSIDDRIQNLKDQINDSMQTAKDNELIRNLTQIGKNPLGFHKYNQLQCNVPKISTKMQNKTYGPYMIMELLSENLKYDYERWNAYDRSSHNLTIAKIYNQVSSSQDKSQEKDQSLWKENDNFDDAQKECEQLDHLNNLVNEFNYQYVKFETCHTQLKYAPSDPLVSIFQMPWGKSLAYLCIQNNCRDLYDVITIGVLEGLEVANKGPFFHLESLSADKIHYFENAEGSRKVILTDVRLNQLHSFNYTALQLMDDMDEFAYTMVKLILRNCSSSVPKEAKQSSIDLFHFIHSHECYDYDDFDLGVDPMIFQESDHIYFTRQSKIRMLDNSIYDFLYKMFYGPHQFKTVEEARSHNWLVYDVILDHEYKKNWESIEESDNSEQ